MEKAKKILKNKKAATGIVAAVLVILVSTGVIDSNVSDHLQEAANSILSIFAE